MRDRSCFVTWHRMRVLACVGVLGIAGGLGCASIPAPREEISTAELAIRRAEQGQAAAHAPLEMQLAREQLEMARKATGREDFLVARRAAEKALVDAELAATKAQTAQTGEMARSIQNDIDALRAETNRATERLQ